LKNEGWNPKEKEGRKMTFKNDGEALTEALFLALTAGSDADADRAAALATTLAAGLAEADVEDAKAAALQRARRVFLI
jgi:hypothetical protein